MDHPGDYTIGIGQKVNSTGNKTSDFYEMAFIDVFFNTTANNCMEHLMMKFLTAGKPFMQRIMYDGLYIRENEPFTISNGADLNISNYVINSTNSTPSEKDLLSQLKRKSKQLLNDVNDPEAIGQYEDYLVSNNQTIWDFNNLPFVPGFK